ncbi:MvaI/BcnI family restriction endonuclease [Pseudomonas syringae]|uniref:MvaI/BcnI family restriction endonuclease n=1 Tax=Pseudomonas syringae TaxID=317 RepID=UPI000AA89C5F|nr:MvaI/BcnI family restriction endonuclease [Pseudomonas syringae]
MSGISDSPLEYVSRLMRSYGAKRIVFKPLANNDNSKQQIYFGGDFDVLRLIPHGDLIGEPTRDKGVMFKASLKLSWIDVSFDTPPVPAPGAQLIFYPRYPEVRMSGFIRGSSLAPAEIMRPPTLEERACRVGIPRCLVLGFCDDQTILAYADTWDGKLSREVFDKIVKGQATKIASVFFEQAQVAEQGRILLLQKLSEIYTGGAVRSGRLDANGKLIEYQAKNGAGYTLESLFGIIPNGRAEPDYQGWELKAHGSGVVTLMTPEPDAGIYRYDLAKFILDYGVCNDVRRDFTGKHLVDIMHDRSGLTLLMEGYDPEKFEVVDPNGGLVLRDRYGNIAACWSFNKILTHWSKKHAQTAFVSYTVEDRDVRFFRFGPAVSLCEGANLKYFLNAMHSSFIYYDPGVNMKLVNDRWVAKKRNQFRVSWKNIDSLYERVERVVLS